MICEKCGKELSDDAALCTSCGWKTAKWEAEKENGAAQHKSVYIAFVTIAITLAVCVAAIIWVILSS